MNTNAPGREPEPTDAELLAAAAKNLTEVDDVREWVGLRNKATARGREYLSGARPMPETPAPIDEGRVWAFMRDVLMEGGTVWYAPGTREEKHAITDGRAAHLTKKFLARFGLDNTPAPDEVAQLRAEVAELRLRHEGNALELGTRVNAELQDTILAANTALTARIADLERENAALKKAGDNLWPCAIAHAAIYQRDHGEKYLHPTHAASLSEWIRLVPEGKRTLEEAGLVPPTPAAPGKEPTDAE